MFSCRASQVFSEIFVLIVLGFVTHAWAADDVGGIIAKEKSEYQSWLSHDDDIPSAILWPYGNEILIYNESMDDDPNPSLCANLAVDQLTDREKQQHSSSQSPINFLSPNVRTLWADACLIRPTDELMAIGPGQQMKITVDRMMLEVARESDQKDSSLIVTGVYDMTLPFIPFLFSSDFHLTEGYNNYTELKGSSITVRTSPWNELLENEIKFFDEFDGMVYVSTAPNFDAIVALKKREITPDDVSLQNEMVLMIKNNVVTTLVEERVEQNVPSGHVSPVGWFDFNNDGFLDLIVQGDHQSCVYEKLFLGGENGLSSQSVPNSPCYVQ